MLKYVMARKRSKSIYSGAISVLLTIGGIFRSPVVIAWMLAISGMIGLVAMSVPKLRATRISTEDVRVTFQDTPTWLDESLLLELQGIAQSHLAKTAVGRDGLILTKDALAATGWFSNIQQVRWASSNEVVIEASFLIPYAKVLDTKGMVFVDVHGICLPIRMGLIVKPNYHFITLFNPQFQRPQRPGLQWNGEDIQDGIALLKYIYDKPWVSQITSIDINKSWLTMVTKTPSNFIWGSAPGKEHSLEALAHQKIDRLKHLDDKNELIDRGISGEFDLTDLYNIIRR